MSDEKKRLCIPTISPGSLIAVWFSCGAASAIAAKLAVERYGDSCDVRVMNNPVREEDEDNRRFLKDVEEWIGRPIEIVVSDKYPGCSAREVWAREKWMGGINGASCTTALKKLPRQAWENANLFNFSLENWLVMGFTSEEVKRHCRFVETERENLLPLLIAEGLTKRDCWRLLAEAGIKLPSPYLKGFPNSNCVGCVKASSPTYWNLVRKEYPSVFADRAKQSRKIGARLVEVKGERVFLDELSPGAVGGKLKSLNFECGVFCEEKGN